MAGASTSTPPTPSIPSPLARQVLAVLGDGRPRSANDLAARLGMSSAALTDVLSWLVSHALIRRAGTRTVVNALGGRCRVSLWTLSGG